MLDAETKRRIDTCRDILVGKVPDPKSQVEQITIALIYKFMDDMDSEAEDLGGKRSFFAGDFAHYGWARLKSPELSGKEKLDLYAEAIGKMNENPGIPALFRDIFKNAYLPYRDPETLRAFLKEIDGFTYEHSERLGDAFEYLLSVLGSQGDAGQFRTPRHIIDFMVEVINPQKHESILDPACGTAGFLISAWKHIFAKNAKDRPGDQLTPDERQNLAANIRGYDISPDMVRLSLVNLYLHGFTDPHIVEYDTLTSEERWNETADVILANPPFMSPKGGIKPHKRFSVQATRSEVLFVDYMAEHLSPQGRAAIVVPEGIIFQSGTAYKKLREMLVKNSLIAVVSLPAGVFNPYSGVKTSILILDRRRAKTCDSVLFVKVENDGFGLGAQRRAVTGSGLPEAKRLLEAFFAAPEDFENGVAAHKVARAKIGENGEWNLSGERYVRATAQTGAYEYVALEELCEYVRGVTYSKLDEVTQDGLLVLRANNIDAQTSKLNLADIKQVSNKLSFSDTQRLKRNDILICAASGSADHVGKVAFADADTPYHFGGFMAVLRCSDRLMPRYLFECLKIAAFRGHLAKSIAGANINNLKASIVHSYEIPLPPLAIQQEIVTEIEGYQKVIDGARQVVENYRPRIDVQPDWPIVPLGETCEIQRGKFSYRPRNEPRFYGGKYPFIQTGDIVRANGGKITHTQTLNDEGLSVSKLFQPPIVVITIAANIGDTAVLDFPSCFPDSVVGLIPKSGIDARFLELSMRTQKQHLNNIAPQAAQKNINIEILKTIKIPVPPIETQHAIAAEIEAVQALVDANKQLIARFEAKIKATIDRVWVGGE